MKYNQLQPQPQPIVNRHISLHKLIIIHIHHTLTSPVIFLIFLFSLFFM